MSRKQQVIVAELGRPETTAETRARKTRDSRLYRERKTVNNLVLSLLVSVGLVAVIFLAVPRGIGNIETRNIDAVELAAQASASAGQTLIAPQLPAGWTTKQAELRYSEADKVTYWYVSYTTDAQQFAAFTQAFGANDTWIAEQLERQSATGVETIGDQEWIVYDHSESASADTKTNASFALQTVVGETTLLVYGTDTPDAIRMLAERVVADL
jgi:hypothetical protein